MVNGQGRIDHEHERNAGDQRHRGKVGRRVVGQRLVQRDLDGQLRAGAHEQRVAVGRGAGDRRGRDDATRAESIFDHERFAEPIGQIPRDHAGEQIGAAAGRVGRNHGDEVGRIVLRARQGRNKQEARDRGGGQASRLHRLLPCRNGRQTSQAGANWSQFVGCVGSRIG
jgi:hypothetical protein